MVCLYCGHKTDVINSRPQKRLNQVWRRRQCVDCQAVFTTTEAAVLADSLMVSAGGTKNLLQPFIRDKLFISIYTSCGHRKTAVTDASSLTDTVLNLLRSHSQNGVIYRQQLIDTVKTVLGRFDNAASVHYSAFHQD